MAVHASHAALPYPIKGARFSFLVPYLDADGDPTAPTTPDTEVSKDNGAAADCTEEASATSGMDGMALMTLTGAETDASCVAVNAKVDSGPKATLGTFYPRVLASVGTGTLSAGSAGGGTLGTLLPYDVTGCFIRTTGGTGGGGTGGANNQARKIVTYNTSTGAFTVSPNWETTPSTDTTYEVLLPDGVTLGMLRALNPTTAGRTLDVSSDGDAEANVTKYGGAAGTFASGRPEVNTTLIKGSDATNQIRDAIVDDATRIDASALNTLSSHDPGETIMGATDTVVLTDGSLTAAKIAGDAITAAKIAADAIAEIQSGLGTSSNQATIINALTTIAGYIDTEIAAIKAKTDNLPSDPADQSAVEAAITAATSGLATQASVDDLPTNAELATALGGLNIPTAEQNREEMDANSTQLQQIIEDIAAIEGGGNVPIIVAPLQASIQERVNGTKITYYKGETIATTIAITDATNQPLDLSSFTLQLCFERHDSSDIAVIEDGDITVSGPNNNQITFSAVTAMTQYVSGYSWSLRETGDDQVLARGTVEVKAAALKDPSV